MRRAISLVEVVVALAIMAILAAAIYPAAAGRWRAGQAAALGTQLDAMQQSIAAYRADVLRHPRTLTQLTTALAPGAQDACGGNVPASLRARWRGPYLNKVVSGNVRAGDATIQNVLDRLPPTAAATQVGQLRILVAEVDSAIAAILEREYDAAPDYTAGTILWAGTVAPLGTLTFQVPIRGC
jgi:prepilin-type N-terminal cleavage/methylation domain-containing protein